VAARLVIGKNDLRQFVREEGKLCVKLVAKIYSALTRLVIPFFLFCGSYLVGQPAVFPHIGVLLYEGSIMPTNDFIRGENLSGAPICMYRASRVHIGLQGDGLHKHDRMYRFPEYGIGIGRHDFGTKELGNPYSVYGYLYLPLVRFRGLEAGTEVQYGMAMGWNKYDKITNPKNEAIGSGFTVHAATDLRLSYALSKWIKIGAGIGFTHFSNGRFERPNNGVNVLTPSLQLKYFPLKSPSKLEKFAETPTPKLIDFSVVLGYGNHQRLAEVDDHEYFAIAGLSLLAGRQFSYFFRARAGVDLNYIWSLSVLPDGSHTKAGWRNFTYGWVCQPEMPIGNFTLFGGLGIYARHAEYGNYKQWYQRLGMRFNFNKKMSLAANIRSVNFYQAEFMEFQLGYHFVR
jgi:hypothetical protein